MKLFCERRRKKREERKKRTGTRRKQTPRPTHFLVHTVLHHEALGVPVIHTQQMSGGVFVVPDVLLCLEIPATHSTAE